LYSQFEMGTFNSHLTSASGYMDLQNAIWYYQGQVANPGNYFTTLVGSSAAEFAPSAGAYGVQVIETSPLPGDTVHGTGQDWLYVPDGGTTIMLLGIGLTGLGLFYRRFAVAS